MLYFLMTTGKCNLKCSYCGGSFPEAVVPWREQFSLEDLEEFIEPNSTIAFYGGEPLLNSALIKRVMDRIEARYIIQTNGILVRKLDPSYWRRMDAVLLSIDGREETTDFYRGKGVYRAVIEAAKFIRKSGFSGDLIARMTASEETDICSDVTHLLSLGIFDHVHWQLDVIWSDRWRNFEKWSHSYMKGLKKLMDLWITSMREGRVLGIVPFLGIFKGILEGGLQAPPCGAGKDVLAISTDGRILACPIAVDAEWACLGDIKSGITRKPPEIGDPCIKCEYFRYCGGRCLYAHLERIWGDEGFNSVCRITKYTIDLVRKNFNRIMDLVSSGIVRKEDLIYPKYNNTTEIIP
ncbi:MAG: TIGR04084 family radical SAM/SPASM domain-containing protein [Candidatus Methanodesulfokora washburnensis]|jgi:putative peptide-modifying radical SAM enzyme